MESVKSLIEEPVFFSPSEVSSVIANNAIGFNIPIYQRLYSWSKREIEKLLKDVKNAFEHNSEKDYFLGNLTLNYNSTSQCFDIIDGQQRMTTLWLIALVLRGKKNDINWSPFLTDGSNALLKFTAREDDNQFLNSLLSKDNSDKLDLDFKRGNKVNLMMLDALKTIECFLAENFNSDKIAGYAKYLHAKVKLAAIFLPDSIDLNKYFEDMNNRGLQLEPHHILKAMLLENIPVQVQKNYGIVWDAVSQMSQYVEYGFEGTVKDNRERISNHNLTYYFTETTSNNDNERSLKDIISAAKGFTANTEKPKTGIEVLDKVFSIITFSEFLLHCLRIFNNDVGNKVTVDEKKLLNTFTVHLFYNSDRTDKAAAFIQFLLQCRVSLDKWFIKSVTSNESARWEIRDINRREDSEGPKYERKKHLEGAVVQLQSMLNVSTDTSVWFTQALKASLNANLDESTFLKDLERIDKDLVPNSPALGTLNKGVNTTRYWFYKLDYLLWLRWTKREPETIIPSVEGIENMREKIQNFQFRDNRSVEHIHPQNPDTETWQVWEYESLKNVKNQFGNLALISTNSNSSYNNQSPKDKRFDFVKRTNKWGIESLKLVSVYAKQEWTIKAMQEHEDEMVKILEEAY